MRRFPSNVAGGVICDAYLAAELFKSLDMAENQRIATVVDTFDPNDRFSPFSSELALTDADYRKNLETVPTEDFIQVMPYTIYALFDDPNRWEYEVDGPAPNWQVRKASQPTTYHVAFALETPVARHAAARMRPLGFYRTIYDGLAAKIGADPRYSGLITKNPLRPPPGCSTQWLRSEPYTLAELREWLPVKIPKPAYTTGVGRNEDLFRLCAKLAHQPRWARSILHEGYAGNWLEHVRLLNTQQFAENPLPDSECRSIAKSCAKYSMLQYSEAVFSEIQTARNTKRWHPNQPDFDYQGRAETVALMFKLGCSRKSLANHFGVSVITIDRDLAKIRKAKRNATN